MIEEIKNYRAAGLRVFPFHPFSGSVCGCDTENCKAAGKHPLMQNWQKIPFWSDEQFETQCEVGKYDQGFGVVLTDSKLLIVDIDTRNGGQRIPELEDKCGFVVATGGGGYHYYFLTNETGLASKHPDYIGVDFKSSGLIVGAGSHHKSGGVYSVVSGGIDQITPAPDWLVDLLKREPTQSTGIAGSGSEVSVDELKRVLEYIHGFDDYHTMIEVGMALHNTTDGSSDGLLLWDAWCSQSDKYDGSDAKAKKWASFGRSSRVVTVATLIYLAEQNGYTVPITFDITPAQQAEIDEHNLGNDLEKILKKMREIDITKPHGFVGEVARYIDSQCLYPRKSFSALKALEVVGTIGGIHYRDALTRVAPNTIFIAVGGSGTGKGYIEAAGARLFESAGMLKITYKDIKSKQEMVRNLLEHQCAIYTIDEVGHFFGRVGKSDQSYLSAIMPFVMEVYTLPNGTLPISGDLRRETMAGLKKELSRLEKKQEENEQGLESKIEEVKRMIDYVEKGLPNPFLSLTGYTTSTMLGNFLNHETIQNGLISRSIIIQERDTNPRINPNYTSDTAVPPSIQFGLCAIASASGSYSITDDSIRRYSAPELIPYSKEAESLLNEIREYYWQRGEQERETSGNEALTRRCAEQVQKFALICGIPKGIIDVDDILYAFAVVESDLNTKLLAAREHDEHNSKDDVVVAKVLSLLSRDEPVKASVVLNRCRKFPKKDVQACIESLVSANRIIAENISTGEKRTREVLHLRLP